jgi:hypothetical protein
MINFLACDECKLYLYYLIFQLFLNLVDYILTPLREPYGLEI